MHTNLHNWRPPTTKPPSFDWVAFALLSLLLLAIGALFGAAF